MRLNFDEFTRLYRPIKGNFSLFGGKLILFEQKTAQIMQVLAAADDNKVCTLSYEDGEPIINPGLSFCGYGYFITEVPVLERVDVLM